MSSSAATQTDAAESFVFGEQWYENAELRLLPGLLAGKKTFVDVGASVGPYTRCANRAMQGGQITSIEANPHSFERLKANCVQWQGESGNTIKVLNAAVADEPGRMDFFIPDANESTLNSSLFENKAVTGEWRKVVVDCVTLDGLFPSESPDLVKVDVEGAEFRVLKGAHGLLTRGISRFLIEIHPWGDPSLNKTPADIFELMHGYGYDFRRVARHWLFSKEQPSLRTKLKHRGIVLVMRNIWLKERLKKIVLALDRLRKRS